MTLNELKPGQSAVITSVGGENELRCRLHDMGLIPHTKVTLQKVAPMDDLCTCRQPELRQNHAV